MKLRKFVLAVLMLALILALVCGCGAQSSQKRTLNLGFDAEFPPYGYMGDNGEYIGFDIDMAKALCERLNWELKLVPINWDSKDMELESGTIDCIWNGFTINGREEKYTWTDAYMDNSQVFVVRSDSDIVSFSDLNGKVVIVQTESSAQSALEAEENATLLASFSKFEKVGDYNTAFMELESGAADAIAMDIGVARFQMQGREDMFRLLDDALVAEKYGIGFLLGNTELRDEVQSELMKMVEDGTFAKISDTWFGYDVCILGGAS